MQVSKEDYIAWRGHSVTQALFSAMAEHADDFMQALVVLAGENPSEDRKRVGIIEGIRWALDWEPEFIKEENYTDESNDSWASTAG